MKNSFRRLLTTAAIIGAVPSVLMGSEQAVSDDVIAEQRAALAAASEGKGFGPQSPRDLTVPEGRNTRLFAQAPAVTDMSLCNIHFHENAEHRGGDFTTFAGNGDGAGNGTGFKYSGTLSEAEMDPLQTAVGASEHGDLQSGDTIEIHYVYSSARIQPGPTLNSCFNDAIGNPDLRVEAVVAVLVNDPDAVDFTELSTIAQDGDKYQVPNLPDTLGTPIVYAGSTTGPGFNAEASPFQVTWSVRPQVLKVDISSVGTWLQDNPFEEDHAHGVRNLVVNPDLLSPITN